MALLFWCEFPDKTEWKKAETLFAKHKIKADIYAAAKSRKAFESLKKKTRKLKWINVKGAWPVLPKDEGYWFSGFSSRESIDKLDNFKGIPIKIDIEPKIPKGKPGFFNHLLWLKLAFFRKARNSKYLAEKIAEISNKGNIISSTFPLPKFLLKRIGFAEGNYCSYMFYSTLIPKALLPFYKIYYGLFMRNKDKEKTFFALGLIGKGIFCNEPVYKNAKQFEKDILFLTKNNAKNFVIFEFSGLIKRKDNEDFMKAMKSIF